MSSVRPSLTIHWENGFDDYYLPVTAAIDMMDRDDNSLYFHLRRRSGEEGRLLHHGRLYRLWKLPAGMPAELHQYWKYSISHSAGVLPAMRQLDEDLPGGTRAEQIERLKTELRTADAIVISACR